MTPDELYSDLTTEVREALAFLALVVRNNPSTNIVIIMARTDVTEALDVVFQWLNRARQIVNTLPEVVEEDRQAALGTIEGLERSMEDDEAWAYDITSRMFFFRCVWFLEWLMILTRFLELLANSNYATKTWVSRLAPNTCSYCRLMHGTTLPIGSSFAPQARAIGWTRVYGSLMTPPLHPRCLCVLRFS